MALLLLDNEHKQTEITHINDTNALIRATLHHSIYVGLILADSEWYNATTFVT
jgi:hypothetical protein